MFFFVCQVLYLSKDLKIDKTYFHIITNAYAEAGNVEEVIKRFKSRENSFDHENLFSLVLKVLFKTERTHEFIEWLEKYPHLR